MKVASAQKNDDISTKWAICQYHDENVIYRQALRQIENVFPNENSAATEGFDFTVIRNAVSRQNKLPKNTKN